MSGDDLYKYPRTPYLPWSDGAGELVAAPRFLAGRSVVVSEKLDGSNVLIKNGQAHPRSVSGAGRHGWLGMVRKHHAWKTLEYPDVHFYGEDIYGTHAIEYEPVREDETFRLFAVRIGDEFLSWGDTVEWAHLLSVRTVPVLHQYTPASVDDLRALTLGLMDGGSALGGDKEGLVVRASESFPAAAFGDHVAKLVREGHVQPDSEHWSTHWRPCRLLRAG